MRFTIINNVIIIFVSFITECYSVDPSEERNHKLSSDNQFQFDINNSSSSVSRKRSAITSSDPVLATYYIGGSILPYMAGLISPTGIKPRLISLSKILDHFGGMWGDHDSVYNYNYNSTFNSTLYMVNCYCIRTRPCSCDQINSTDLMEFLVEKTGAVNLEQFSNYSHVYINGTLKTAQRYQRSDASKLKSSLSSVYSLSLIVTLTVPAVWAL